MVTSNENGSVIGVALRLDYQKAVADAPVAARQISNAFATALNAVGGRSAGNVTALQQSRIEAIRLESAAKQAATGLLAQAKASESSARASKTASTADQAAAKTLRETTAARLNLSRAATEGVKRTEIDTRATKNLSDADLAAARAKAALAKAALEEARTQQIATREAEKAARAEEKARRESDRGTFGASFSRGFASTRVNVGAASPLLSSATAGGAAGALGAGLAVVGAAAAAAVGKGISDAVTDSIKFDKAFTEVKKFVQGSSAELESLRQEILALSRDAKVGLDFTDLAHIAAFGAQLGVAKSDLSEFTRQVAYLGKAGDISGEEAATGLAKIAAAMGLSADAFPKLASSLTAMGKLGSSTMGEILDAAKRFASEASNLKLNPSEIFAYANAVVSLGQEAEAGGSALTVVFSKIDRAVRTGGKTLEEYARVSGVTTAQFAKNFREKPGQAVAQFLAGLDRLSAKAGAVGGVLDTLGIKNVRQVQAVQNLAKGHNILTAALTESAKAFERGNDAEKAAEIAATSLEAKIKHLQTVIKDDAEKSAEHLKPLLSELIDLGVNGVHGIEKLIEKLDVLGSKDLGPVTAMLARFNAVRADSFKAQAGDTGAKLQLVNRAIQELTKDNRIGLEVKGALDLAIPNLGISGDGFMDPRGAQSKLLVLQNQLQREKANEDGEAARLRGRNSREVKGATTIKKQPGAGEPAPLPGPPDTSPQQVAIRRQNDTLKDLNSRYDRLQKLLGDAADEKTIAFRLGQLKSASAAIAAQEKRIAQSERALALAQDIDKKRPKGGSIIDADFISKKKDADREAAGRLAQAQETADKLRKNLSKESADKAKKATEERAKTGKEAATDSLEVQVQRAERTMKATEERYAAAVKAIDGALSSEGVTAAEGDAIEVAQELRAVGETLARLKKALGDKNAGKATKASADEFAGMVKSGGTLDDEFGKRVGEIGGASKKSSERISESAARAQKSFDDATAKNDALVDEDLLRHNEGVLKALEESLAATPVTKKSVGKIDAILNAISTLRSNVIDLTLEKAVADAKRYRQELIDRIGTEKDTQVKAALEKALDQYDAQKAVFDVTGPNGLPTGKTVAVTGGEQIARYTAEKAAAAAKQKALDDQAKFVKDTRSTLSIPSGTQTAIAGALSGAAGSAFDAALSGSKGGKAFAESLKNSLESGVRGELERGVDRMTQAILSGTEAQKKAAAAQLLAAVQLAASASLLAALSGKKGGKTQGLAIAGTLAGLYLGDRAGLKGDALGSAAQVGGSLLSGNVLGAVLGLTGIKGLNLPRFASGGVPPLGRLSLVGERGPELILPQEPMRVIDSMRSERIVRDFQQARESGQGRGSGMVVAPTINHYGDVNDAADRRYFEEREKRVLQDLVLGMGA